MGGEYVMLGGKRMRVDIEPRKKKKKPALKPKPKPKRQPKSNVEAIGKRLDELVHLSKGQFQKYIKELCAERAEEMIDLLTQWAREGDKRSARFIVEMGIGKPTEHKVVEAPAVQVINDVFTDDETDTTNGNTSVGEV